MARIELVKLAHAYGNDPREPADFALQPLEMIWEDGGAYALLGPSGCGKTTLLNIISGLVRPSHGRVLFDGVDVTDLSPQRRNIAQVFQFPVIYDTMTVFDNLAFPLRNRGMAEAAVRRRVDEVAQMLELEASLRRRASGLSADAKQKISLGRGLVREDVAAILFDEPLTVIDPHLKWQLRRKLKQIHQELKLTLVYVTHDQVEALTFADQVVVMSSGRVMQSGSAEDLFERPQHPFVGHFIGSPGMNFLGALVRPGAPGQWRLEVAGLETQVALPEAVGVRLGAAHQVQVGIRPEHLRVVAPHEGGSLPAHFVGLQHLGTSQILSARVGDALVKARLPEDQDLSLKVGDEVPLSICNPHTCYYIDGKLVS